MVNIGDFKTSNGDIINDCKIGYRTVGILNAEKSNVVLWTRLFQSLEALKKLRTTSFFYKRWQT